MIQNDTLMRLSIPTMNTVLSKGEGQWEVQDILCHVES